MKKKLKFTKTEALKQLKSMKPMQVMNYKWGGRKRRVKLYSETQVKLLISCFRTGK
ncbi:MAG: hypothetical protein GY861_17015 [bacterium]|nr:hypothetical protein [bacterium]